MILIDFSKLFDITYWLRPGPGDLSEPYFYFIIIFFGFFVFLHVLLRFMGRQYIGGLHRAQQQVLYRIEAMLLAMGLLGLLWTFFRFEMVPYFSARYLILIWVLGLIIWAYLVFHYARYEVPTLVERDALRNQQKKYLSKKR